MRVILAIAWTTVLELRRQRLILVPVIAFALSILLLCATLLLAEDATISASEAEIAAWSAGMFGAVGSTLYAVIVGSTLIARELADGTMLMLAARPIGRWQIIVGRVIGAGSFLLVCLVAICAAYGFIACLLSGSTAPLDEPFRTLEVGVPVLLLGLAVGVAFSIQGKATAATGSAIAVCAFAIAAASYASSWREEQHLRSYLDDDAARVLDPNDPIVGRASTIVDRAIPFLTFGYLALERTEVLEQLDYPAPNERADGSIDTTDDRGSIAGWMMPTPAAPAGPAPLAEPTIAEPDDASTTPVPATPTAPQAYQPEPRPDEPDEMAFDCTEYGGAGCFLGYDDAWTQRIVPPVPDPASPGNVAFAWLAIPAWIGAAILLLRRRRDLTA